MKPETEPKKEIGTAGDSKSSSELRATMESDQEKAYINIMNDLYQAIDNSDAERVQTIVLKSQVDINGYHPSRDDNPLIYAVTNYYYEITKLLLALGANPNIKTKTDCSCIADILFIEIVGKHILNHSIQAEESEEDAEEISKDINRMTNDLNKMIEIMLCYNFLPVDYSDGYSKMIPQLLTMQLSDPETCYDEIDQLKFDPIKKLTLSIVDLIEKHLPKKIDRSSSHYKQVLELVINTIKNAITSDLFQKEYGEVIQQFKDKASKDSSSIQREKSTLFFSYQNSPEFKVISSYIWVDPAKIVLSYAVDFSKEVLEKRLQSKLSGIKEIMQKRFSNK